MRWFSRFLALSAILAVQDAGAQSVESVVPALPEACVLKAESKRIRLLHCAPDLETEQLAQAGRAACGSLVPCGVWIWSDAALVPAEAPENHDGLTREQVSSAMAAWVAEDELLVRIDELKK